MKYIRTKDDRLFRVIKDLTYENTYYFETKAEMLTIMTEEKYLSTMGKVADTIEELCDWFVLKEDNKIRVLYDSLENAITCEENDIARYEIIGAIETDKGLIYVAKMNSNGELELL